MVNSNMSKILIGSSVKRRKTKTDDNLVDKRKVCETSGTINTLAPLYSTSNAF